jgi:UDP-N-acetylmuramoyl-tripeptide--D-alanyl-D-alanine ligase
MKNVYPFSYIYHTIYLLQLENYDLGRFFRIALTDSFRRLPQQRKEIVWTPNILITSILTIVCASCVGALAIYFFVSSLTLPPSLLTTFLFAALVFVSLCHLFFVFVTIVVLLLKPFDVFRKRKLFQEARARVRSIPRLNIIAVAGSYGKTTAKECISAVLSTRYKTLSSRGNENTPVGIARVVLSSLTPDTEVFVVEMGEYVPGDIAHLCHLTPPDVSVVTGINEAHFERMKSLKHTTDAVFEVVTHAKQGAHILLNRDDHRVRSKGESLMDSSRIGWFGRDGEVDVREVSFDETGLITVYSIYTEGSEIARIRTPLLGTYVPGMISLGFLIGRIFNISNTDVANALESMRPLPHRLEPRIDEQGVVWIDDSYNGNPDGVREALKTLARFKARRKIFLTPGLVELGEKSHEIHYALGKDIARTADKVVLIKTSASHSIRQGLIDASFPESNILMYSSMIDALSKLEVELTRGDVVLIQNDWPDNYR